MTQINMSEKLDKALWEKAVRDGAKHENPKRAARSQKRLDALLAEKPEPEVWFVFGNTYEKKEDLKAAGWQWFPELKVWFSKKDIDSCGLEKISA